MQMNEQILTALEVLRNFAENDFELHRIDVLEKDLTEPPKVEIIDDTHQKFLNEKYHVNSKGHYIGCGSRAIHRAIYKYYYGDIPKGYDVHHKDLNPANNNIFNLQLLTPIEHCQLHWKLENEEKFVFKVCGKIFTAKNRYFKNKGTTPLFCSNRCRHRFDYANNREIRECAFCGKNFDVWKGSPQKFCSESCAAKNRYLEKQPKVAICPNCGKEFIKQTSKQKYCCCECFREKTKKINSIVRICPICGKKFKVKFPSSRTKTCSHSCGAKLMNQRIKQQSS